MSFSRDDLCVLSEIVRPSPQFDISVARCGHACRVLHMTDAQFCGEELQEQTVFGATLQSGACRGSEL